MGATDLDGNPRIVGGTVDVGAYEFQSPGLARLLPGCKYGLPTDGSADLRWTRTSDGMNNWQEWVAGTDPTNAASLLRLLPPVVVPPALLLRWNSDANHTYFIERATGLDSSSTFSLLQANIPGQADTTTFTDSAWASAAFYRVGTDSGGGFAPLWLEVPQFRAGDRNGCLDQCHQPQLRRGAQDEPVGPDALCSRGHKPPRPTRHDELYGYQPQRPRTVPSTGSGCSKGAAQAFSSGRWLTADTGQVAVRRIFHRLRLLLLAGCSALIYPPWSGPAGQSKPL